MTISFVTSFYVLQMPKVKIICICHYTRIVSPKMHCVHLCQQQVYYVTFQGLLETHVCLWKVDGSLHLTLDSHITLMDHYNVGEVFLKVP